MPPWSGGLRRCPAPWASGGVGTEPGARLRAPWGTEPGQLPWHPSLCKTGRGCAPQALLPSDLPQKNTKPNRLSGCTPRHFREPEVRLGTRFQSAAPDPCPTRWSGYKRSTEGCRDCSQQHTSIRILVRLRCLITSSGRPSLIYPPHLPPPGLITPASSPTLILLLPKGI